MKKTTIEIDSFTMTAGNIVWTAWFWLDGKPVHLGHFDSKVEAEWAGRAAQKVAALQREFICKQIKESNT